MSITVAPTLWGYHVTIRGGDRERFATALESFKQAIPRRTRLFQPAQGYWFIDKRSERQLRRWLEAVRAADVRFYEAEKAGGEAA